VTERVPVGDADDFEDGSRELVDTPDGEVGVFHVEGEFYALRNQCAHDGGPVCRGQVRRELVGEFEAPGEHIAESYTGDLTVGCPWHGFTYYLDSGIHIGDDSIRIPSYDVVVEDGVVYVEV
jgi:nitrite reductase/ring-hydroxylating ferredoxin subunit